MVVVGPYEIDGPKLIELLATEGSAARQRTAYLLNASGNRQVAQQIIDIYRPTGTAWLGPQRRDGHFDPLTKVSDTVLHTYLSIGRGA